MDAKRPRLLWILFTLLIVQGAFYVWWSIQYGQVVRLLDETTGGWMEHGSANPESLVTLWLYVITWGVLGGGSLLIAVALRSGRNWVWTAALIAEGAILILSLEKYLNRGANMLYYVAMGLAIAITFLLNQREIQIFFHAHQHTHLEGHFGQ